MDMIKSNSINKSAIIKSIIVLIIVAILSTVYEFTKNLLIPDITIWQSHAITIIIISLTSFFASFHFYQHDFLKKSIKNEFKELKNSVHSSTEIFQNQFELLKNELNQLYTEKPFFIFQRKYLLKKNLKAIELFDKFQQELEEQRLSKDQLQKYANQLAELNATKNKFFSIISHDLKNPFSILIGMSELLIKIAEKSDKEKIIEQARIINEASNRAFVLLSDLLEWSNSQTGRQIIKPEKLNIFSLINDKIVEFENFASTKNLFILNECDKDICVFADYNSIMTVLRNLLSNAIKFSNINGVIVIKAEQNQDEIKVSFSDNGVGIESNVIQNLFRIDVNASTTGTNGEMGTGLGLILCKEFIEKNNGKIWVESELGKGSNFIFTLPVYKPNN